MAGLERDDYHRSMYRLEFDMHPNEYLRIALMAAAVLLVTACTTAVIVHTPLPDQGLAIR